MAIKIIAFCLSIQALMISVSLGQNQLVYNLDSAFNEYLSTPASYSIKVKTECSIFPEGQLLPYTLVSQSWCHQIFSDPSSAARRLPKIETALELAIASTADKLSAPNGNLMQMSSIANHGSFVTQLALTLSSYRLAGGKRNDLVKIESHLINLLTKELREGDGQPINSYPGKIDPLETTVALFAIELNDRVTGQNRTSRLLPKHRRWILTKGTDKKTGLPASQILANGNLQTARGSDLSIRLAMWHEMDPEQSTKWYRQYRSTYWKNSKLAKGYREWPNERIKTTDLDSGPILSGIGTAATTLGLCATKTHTDNQATQILYSQAELLASARNRHDFFSKMMVRTVDKGLNSLGIKVNTKYETGFLFGDATAFYAFTWRSYPHKPLR